MKTIKTFLILLAFATFTSPVFGKDRECMSVAVFDEYITEAEVKAAAIAALRPKCIESPNSEPCWQAREGELIIAYPIHPSCEQIEHRCWGDCISYYAKSSWADMKRCQSNCQDDYRECRNRRDQEWSNW